MRYFIEQIEEDIRICNEVYCANYNNEGEYGKHNNEVETTCREMIGYYADDIEFPSFVYNKFDEESLYMIKRLLDKHRRYILDTSEEERCRKEIQEYKDKINMYEDKIRLYKDRINGLQSEIILLKENIKTITYSKQAINIFTTQTQEVTTTVDVDIKVESRFEDARNQIVKDNKIEDKQEILDKINELERIYIDDEPSNTKMEKVKKVASWLGNKSYKAMQLLIPLIQTIIEANTLK